MSKCPRCMDMDMDMDMGKFHSQSCVVQLTFPYRSHSSHLSPCELEGMLVSVSFWCPLVPTLRLEHFIHTLGRVFTGSVFVCNIAILTLKSITCKFVHFVLYTKNSLSRRRIHPKEIFIRRRPCCLFHQCY
jgi:hypothetical protein